jgi:hypothetical protein
MQNNDIFSLMGLDSLSEKDKEAFINQFDIILMSRVMLRLEKVLDTNQKKELDKIASENKDNPEKIIEFLGLIIPNYEVIIKEEIDILKNEMIENSKK